jgi:hypothetical protein
MGRASAEVKRMMRMCTIASVRYDWRGEKGNK